MELFLFGILVVLHAAPHCLNCDPTTLLLLQSALRCRICGATICAAALAVCCGPDVAALRVGCSTICPSGALRTLRGAIAIRTVGSFRFPPLRFSSFRLFGLSITSHHRHPRLSQSIAHPRPFIAVRSSIVSNDLYSRHRSHRRACARRQKGKRSPFRNILRRSESRAHFQRRQCFITKVADVVVVRARYPVPVAQSAFNWLLLINGC